MFKCLPTEFGVDVSVNSFAFFSFNSLTHLCIDLGNNNVRIERKIDGLREILSTPASSFTRLDGSVISTTHSGLNAYLMAKSGAVKAGQGIAVDSGTVSVVAGGPATLGGYRVGNGLMVDGAGRLSATAVSEVTKVLGTEAEMLSQTVESLRPYRIIRLDTKRLYYLNAGESPAVLANWFVGPSIEAAVVSFKGRTGVVLPEAGDYTHDMVSLIDKTTASSYHLVIDGGKLYVENTQDQVRTEFQVAGQLATIQTSLTQLSDTVNSPSNGLVKKVGELTTETARLSQVVSNGTTGLEVRVAAIESKPVADLVAGKVPYEQLPPVGLSEQQAARLTAVESSASLANQKGDSAATNILAVDTRLSQVNDTLDSKINTLQSQRTSDKALIDAATNKNNTQDSTISTNASVTTRHTTEIAALQTNKLDVTTRGASSGVASLGADSKVPLAQLPATVGGSASHANTMVLLDSNGKLGNALVYRDVASGLAPLDTNRRVPVVNLPAFYPQSKRIWRDVKSSRNVGTWVTNTGSGELEVHVRQSLGTTTNRFVSLQVRENASGTVFVFNSTVLNPIGTSGVGYADSGTITVPGGWQYQVATVGGLTDALIERWYEFY